MAILHGGQLSRVAQQYQIPEKEWLDLSTGIAPFSYPVAHIPLKIWQNLPTVSTSLMAAAQHYYQALHCWPLAGSQQLIEKLPQLWNAQNKGITASTKHVYLPKVGYKEHQQAWQQAGYQLHFYQKVLPTDIEHLSVVVVINPNNPLTDTFSIDALKILQQQCRYQQALLIIDEAFADIFPPEFSFVTQLKDDSEDVIVLRSFGKFFGLAGLRIGFVCSSKKWCELIQESNGPWSVNSVALYIAEQALNDKCWQQTQITRLQKQSIKQEQLLQQYFSMQRIESNALFITIFLTDASALYKKLCLHAVYVRLSDENDALRFGLCDELQLITLAKVLAKAL
ncbi:MAG: threonine-phosphate decarboxylase, partial [Psychromonas sp.]